MQETVEIYFLNVPENKINQKTIIRILKKKFDYVFKSNVQEYRSIANDKYWKFEISNETKRIKNIIEKTIDNKNIIEELADLFVLKKGLPDLMIINNNKIEFWELKINRDGISKEQIIVANKLRKLGFVCKFVLIFGQ